MMSKQVEFSHCEISFRAYDQQSRFTLPAQALDLKPKPATLGSFAFQCALRSHRRQPCIVEGQRERVIPFELKLPAMCKLNHYKQTCSILTVQTCQAEC